MISEKLKTALSQLNNKDLYLTLWFARLRWLRHKIGLLWPAHIVLPAAILQIVVFVFAAFTQGQFMIKFFIAAALMLPLMLQPGEVKVLGVSPEA